MHREGLAAHVVKLFEGLLCLFFVKCLAMPAIFIFQEGDPFAFDRPGNNPRRRAIRLRSLGKGPVDLVIVVTIDDNGVPAKSSDTCSLLGSIPTPLRFTSLPPADCAAHTPHRPYLLVLGRWKT